MSVRAGRFARGALKMPCFQTLIALIHPERATKTGASIPLAVQSLAGRMLRLDVGRPRPCVFWAHPTLGLIYRRAVHARRPTMHA